MKRRLFVKTLGASIPAASIATSATAAPMVNGTIKPRAATLGLPPVYDALTKYRNGLVIISSPVDGGKSTTLRFLMERFANARKADVQYVGDSADAPLPTEIDTSSFAIGREFPSFGVGMFEQGDSQPSLILVGEIRDWYTLDQCIKLAESSRLVYATVHGSTAWNTIARLIRLDHFRENGESETRERLARTLRAVMAQSLLPRKDGRGRIAAVDTVTNAEFFQEQLRLTPIDILTASLVPDSARHPDDVSMQSSIRRLIREKKVDRSVVERRWLS
jgi:twitching motility protein PilT